MPTRVLLIALAALLTTSCGGGDKHLPSSNPPEYDPNKDYTSPRSRVPQPATEPARSAVPEEPPIALPSLAPGPDEKGEWRKVPMKLESFHQLKDAKTLCDALSQLVHGLGSAQLFAGAEGAALKKSLGAHVESMAQMLDEQLAESMKQALGPAAANCPTPSAKSRKMNSKDLSQPVRIVLANSSSSHPLLLAQATPSQGPSDDYTVTTTKQKQDAPPGWIGWKTTDRTTRVGNRRETRGSSSKTVLVLGGKALKCPTPDGVVHGDYEYAMTFDQTIMESGATRSVHIGQRAVATLKGQVGDDAKLQYIEVDVSLVIERGGTDLSAVARRERHQFRFTPDRGFPMLPTHFSESSALGWGSEATAADIDILNNLLAGIMGFSGVLYMQAEQEWWKANTCVEIIFTPATKTHKLGPNESVPVKTELRTKKERAVVPSKFKEAKERPREGTGNVSPRQAEAQPGAPATFTYKAPATRVRHSGFWVGAMSRAGVAEAQEGEWETVGSGLRLKLGHRIQADPQSAHSMAGHAQFDGAVQFDVPLEQFAEGWFRGEVNVIRPLVVRHVRPAANPCSGSGSQIEHWIVSAHVDPKTDFMDIQFGFTPSNEQASWTCSGPAGTFTDDLMVELFGSLESVQMSTKTGTKKDINGRNINFLEWLSVMVVEGLD